MGIMGYDHRRPLKTRNIYTMVTLKRLNTTYTKDNDNPVQMVLDKIFLYPSLNKKHAASTPSLTSSSTSSLSSITHDTDIKDSTARTANLRRMNSAVWETKMRDRTAHIGRKASFASQGLTWSW